MTGLPTRQPAPAFTFTVWDESGSICILAKIEASFSITYDIKGGTQVKKYSIINLKLEDI